MKICGNDGGGVTIFEFILCNCIKVRIFPFFAMFWIFYLCCLLCGIVMRLIN